MCRASPAPASHERAKKEEVKKMTTIGEGDWVHRTESGDSFGYTTLMEKGAYLVCFTPRYPQIDIPTFYSCMRSLLHAQKGPPSPLLNILVGAALV